MSVDADQIRAWFKERPEMNYGVAGGERHVIVDLDVKESANGIEALSELQAKQDVLDWIMGETFTVQTPSGGRHLYLTTEFPVSNAHRFPAGVDVRGAHGYVVGPGCQLESGGGYIVEDPSADIARAPPWVVQRLKRQDERDANTREPVFELDSPEAVNRAREFLLHRDPAIEGRCGHDHTYITACHVKDMGVSEVKTIDLMCEDWNDRCEPPWEPFELAGIVANAFRYGRRQPGAKGGGPAAEVFGDLDGCVDIANVIPLHPDKNIREAADIPYESESGRPRRSFRPRSEAEQDAQPEPDWLIPGVLQRETLALFYGPESSFKSFMVLDLVLSAAAGVPWAGMGDRTGPRGYSASRPLTTVFIAGEGASGVETLRRPAWRKAHGIDTPLPFFTIGEMPRFGDPLEVTQLIQDIDAAAIMPDIVVVDTVARAMIGLDENSARDAGILTDALDRLKRHFRCSIVAVHHSGKDVRKGSRGSSAIPFNFDARFAVSADRTVRSVTIRNEKQKDAPEWTQPAVFQGEPVAVSEWESGGAKSSLVFGRVLPPPTSTAAPEEADSDLLILAIEIIRETASKMPLTMNVVAEEMARRYAGDADLSDGEMARSKETMRNFLRNEVTGRLAKYANKASRAKTSPWRFEWRD